MSDRLVRPAVPDSLPPDLRIGLLRLRGSYSFVTAVVCGVTNLLINGRTCRGG
jgi:hypothetical protein